MSVDNGASSYRRFRDNGDENGLVEIIRDYKDGLILFLASIVGDMQTAEEAAEDTFVVLGIKKPKDKGRSSFKTWLYTIGRNVAIDHLRKKARNKETDFETVRKTDKSEESLEESYIKKERDIAIHRAMKRLKPEYRQVLWLLYFEELSAKECACIMKKSVHAIETMAYRAKKSMRLELELEGLCYEDI